MPVWRLRGLAVACWTTYHTTTRVQIPAWAYPKVVSLEYYFMCLRILLSHITDSRLIHTLGEGVAEGDYIRNVSSLENLKAIIKKHFVQGSRLQ